LAANISVATPRDDDGPLIDGGSWPEQVVEHAASLYFFADDGVHGKALWLDPDNDLGYNLRLLALTPIGDRLYFISGSYSLSSDQTLWSFDGERATPLFTLDINAQANYAKIVEYAGELFVFLGTSDGKLHVWKYDGTSATPLIIQDGSAGQEGMGIVYQNALYFAMRDPEHGSELHRYNGTSIERVTDITPGPGDSVFGEFTEFRGKLYFTGQDDGRNDIEVWSYDGTTATLAIELWPGNDSSGASALFVRDDSLFLSATDGAGRGGLWSTNGDDVLFAGGVHGLGWRIADLDGNLYSVVRSDESDTNWRCLMGHKTGELRTCALARAGESVLRRWWRLATKSFSRGRGEGIFGCGSMSRATGRFWNWKGCP
jgi:ELWxxDGT repeat protein